MSRSRLGEFHFDENTTPYDIAVVVLEYLKSRPEQPVYALEKFLGRYAEYVAKEATPGIRDKLDTYEKSLSQIRAVVVGMKFEGEPPVRIG
jgi:hypothetical protein